MNKQGTNQYEAKLTRKAKAIIVLMILTFVLTALTTLTLIINEWFNTHYFIFKAPVELAFNKPVTVEIRKSQIVEKKVILDFPEAIDTPIKKYICQVFGNWECKTAVAVASHEGLNHPADGFNINTNGTIDVGYFRINSIHFNKPGCSLKEVTDPYKNVDCAYKIWKASGWSAWVAYQNGNYLSSL